MENKLQAYWKANLRILIILLSIWLIIGVLCPILFVHQLNTIQIGGFKLGLWMAFQGSILLFIVLMFVYTHRMNKLDKEYGVED